MHNFISHLYYIDELKCFFKCNVLLTYFWLFVNASRYAYLWLNVVDFHDVHVQEIYVGAHLIDDFAGIYFRYALSVEGAQEEDASRGCISTMFIDILNGHIDMIISLEIAWAMLCEYFTDICSNQ